jgi:hypothetical protein
VNGECKCVRTECATDVLIRQTARAQSDAWDKHADIEHVLAGRQRVEFLMRDDRLLGRGLHVDDRRFSRNRDRFRDVAHFQVGVDGGCKRTCELHAVSFHGAESCERKRQRVRAGQQLSDAVLAAPVRDGGPRLLKERRTRRFDGHAGKHGSGLISHDSSDRGAGLSEGHTRNDQREQNGVPNP